MRKGKPPLTRDDVEALKADIKACVELLHGCEPEQAAAVRRCLFSVAMLLGRMLERLDSAR